MHNQMRKCAWAECRFPCVAVLAVFMRTSSLRLGSYSLRSFMLARSATQGFVVPIVNLAFPHERSFASSPLTRPSAYKMIQEQQMLHISLSTSLCANCQGPPVSHCTPCAP